MCVPSIAAIWAASYRMLMRLLLLLICLISACDVFRGSLARPKTQLTPEQFVEVYVALARARTPAEKQQILKQHKTTEKALHEFVQAYSRDLPRLSATFDSALSRLNAPEKADDERPR
jgi:hypothetical protein